MKLCRALLIAAAAYAGIAIATFGVAAHKSYEVLHGPRCDTPDKRLGDMQECIFAKPAGDGFISALFWPLWWSWEVADIAMARASECGK